MTTDRDLDAILGTWLGDGPSAAPDRMLHVLGDRISRKRQRPAWQLRPWAPGLSTSAARTARLGLVVAGLVVALVASALMLGGGGFGPGPSPTSTTNATPSPSPTASPRALAEPHESGIPAGSYRYGVYGGGTTFTVPDGWAVPALGSLDFALAPIGAADGDTVRVFYDMRVAARDADCSEVPEAGFGSTAADIIGALAADPALTTTTPQPISIGGLDGLWIDVELVDTWTATCPFAESAPARPLVVDAIPAEGPFWGIAPDERERIIVLDHPAAGNVTFVIDSSDGTTFDDLVAQTMPVLETFSFGDAP